MSSPDLCYLPAGEAAALIKSRQLSPRELVLACLERIEALNPKLNAFVLVCAEQALAAAEQSEREAAAGRAVGPLHGIPFAAKDVFDTKGLRTAAGSRILAERVPDESATAVERMEQAGAILIGKTNTHEFAFGVTTINPHFVRLE